MIVMAIDMAFLPTQELLNPEVIVQLPNLHRIIRAPKKPLVFSFMIGVPPLWPLRVLKHDLRTHFIRHRGSKLRWDKSNLHIKYGELITCIGPCIGNWFRLFAIGIQQISSLNSFMGPISFEASLKMFECIFIIKCIVLWFYDSMQSQPVKSLHFFSACWSVFLAPSGFYTGASFLLEPKWAGR